MFEKLAEKLKEKNNREIEFKPYEEVTAAPELPKEEIPAPAPKAQPSDISVATSASAVGGKVELKLVRPESFAEVSTIADHLLAGCTVVLNTELLDYATSLRMFDFLNGVTYSVDGDIKQVTKTTFILTPNNVDVSDEEV
ncbi:MAG: cell division protein SepF [Clostridia bacterium]|nr:cell division protein SepF [Clostridia bacterium]